MSFRRLLPLLIALILTTGQVCLAASPYPWLDIDPPSTETIQSRIPAPPGFSRVAASKGSFADWLRNLPLLPSGSPVRVFPIEKGNLKSRQDVHYAVVDLDVMRYQQCADTAIRLWAEYLWSQDRATETLCFRMTSGDRLCWKDWMQGIRPKISSDGKRVTWVKTGNRNNGRKQFLKYLDCVMTYAGTYSLKKELAQPLSGSLRIGDILIQGAFPGHAVIIVDMATNEKGEKTILLAQSYMPSQEMHVLKNFGKPTLSPWYAVTAENAIETPEWNPFIFPNDIRRFSVPGEQPSADTIRRSPRRSTLPRLKKSLKKARP